MSSLCDVMIPTQETTSQILWLFEQCGSDALKGQRVELVDLELPWNIPDPKYVYEGILASIDRYICGCVEAYVLTDEPEKTITTIKSCDNHNDGSHSYIQFILK